MTLYLQMDGVDDQLLGASFATDEIVIDLKSRTNVSTYLVSAITGTFNLRRSSNGTYSFTGFTTQVNGASVTSGTNFLTQDVRATVRLTRVSSTSQFRFFAQTATAGFAAGDIYDIKFYNAGALVAHYDMTTGTVQDQSGNGRHATLTGGTWLDDGVGGTPTTQDGSATLKGVGTLSANGNTIQNAIASLLGQGLFTSSGLREAIASASFIGQGKVIANGIREALASASLMGTGVFIADIHEIIIVDAQASLIGNGVLFANGTNGLIWRTIDGEVIPMYEVTQETVNNWETPEITVIIFK